MEEFDIRPNSLEYVSLEELASRTDISFSKITINESFIKEVEGEEKLFHYTSIDEPIAFGKSVLSYFDNAVIINPEYYKANKKYVDKLLVKMILNQKNSSVYLYGVRSNELLDAITQNSGITNIGLYDVDETYLLTEEDYLKLSNCGHIELVSTDGVEEALSDNLDPLIRYNNRSIFSFYSRRDLMELTQISINKDTKIEEIPALKYLNKDAKVKINVINEEMFLNVINVIKEKNNPIIVEFENKFLFNKILNSHPELLDMNITVNYHNTSVIDVKGYYEYEQRLENMIAGAYDLSPFERYLYAYNIVKKYKEYKENKDDLSSSRDIYQLLDNDYMVCVGYATLLIDLCSRLGINCDDLSVSVAVGMEKIKNEDVVASDIIPERGGHARVKLYMKDPKYGIDGIYYADPTWDNYLDKDMYNFCLLTQTEYESIYRENFASYNKIQELFSANNILEFYERVNYILDKQQIIKDNNELDSIKRTYNNRTLSKISESNFSEEMMIDLVNACLKDKYKLPTGNFYINKLNRKNFVMKVLNSVTYSYEFKSDISITKLEELIEKAIKEASSKKVDTELETNVINIILDFIGKLDPIYREDINNRYPSLISVRTKLELSEAYELIEELGSYIITHNNNYVNGNTIMDAVREVCKAYGFDGEDLEAKLSETLEDNKKMFEKNFPQRMRINPADKQDVFINESNKFDIIIEQSRHL